MKPIEISAATKELEEKVNQELLKIKADYGEDKCCEEPDVTQSQLNDVINSLYRYFDYERQYTNSRINDLYNAFYNYTYEHSKGHIPALPASALNKFLKNYNLDEGFEVAKQTIYTTASIRGQKTLIVE